MPFSVMRMARAMVFSVWMQPFRSTPARRQAAPLVLDMPKAVQMSLRLGM